MQIGRVLADRYQLLRSIAEGATGVVWAALDRVTGESVAVKAVSLEQAGWRGEVRDRFLREAQLLRESPHEHLVEVLDVGETEDGYLFLVLELLLGETLAERIARGFGVDWREPATIAIGIARGLGALHARGIVHRDLKPANVILARARAPAATTSTPPRATSTPPGAIAAPLVPGAADPGTPKIIDLGIGKAGARGADPALHATLTATGQVLGTPQYMSYEQARGDRDVDARSDVWSLGVVMHEMLTGRTPFAAPNVNATLASIRRGALPSIADLAPEVPAALAAVTARCLDRDRDGRYPDGNALATALEEVLAASGSAASAPAPATRRSRVPLAIALAVVLGAGALVLLVVSRAPPHRDAQGSSVVHAAAPAASPARSPTVAATSTELAERVAPSALTPAIPASSANPPPPPPAKGPRRAQGARQPGRVTAIDDAGF